MRNINRIRPFIDAMQQYGKIIEVFLDLTNFVAFVWGPMKFLLQVTSNYITFFDIILDEYERMGECFPQFQQYDSLFQGNSYMQTVLGLVYQDILEFHARALKVVQRPAWNLIFRAAWKDLATPFEQIRAKLTRHKGLIECQASLIEFEQAKLARDLQKHNFERIEKEDKRRRRVEITNWLAAADSSSDQEYYESLRREYPGTGSWVLKNKNVQHWFDVSNATNNELWLFGIPGAGKTVLTSVIIEELQKISARTSHSTGATPVSVAYFYCRYRTENKDSFNAVGRGILAQLIQNKEEIWSLIWDKLAEGGEMTLQSSKLLKELLEIAMKDSTISFIVLDGLDECEKTARKEIISTLRAIGENINQQLPGAIRLLFVSTKEPDIQKHLSDVIKVQLKPQDSDIQQYTKVWAVKIQRRFRLSDVETADIVAKVLERAKGMFLYCSLVLKNLHNQGTRAQLERELLSSTFPIGLEKAYERIVIRLYNTSNVQRENASRILDLVACAKRPLKKHEIQGVFAIGDTKDRTVNFHQRSLIDEISDFCGSLIEVNRDGTIQFVHMTARLFLTSRNFIDLASIETNLAHLCVTYLTFDCFNSTLTDEDLRRFLIEGYFSFQDYAMLYWLDHIETYSSQLSHSLEKTREIACSLKDFLERHLNTQAANWEKIQINEGTKHNFKCFQGYPDVYQALSQLASGAAQIRTTNQLEKIGSLGPFTLGFLHLQGHITKVRLELEKVFKSLSTKNEKSNLEEAYGMHLFKCSRPTCAYFTQGFKTQEDRDRHESRHERPFFCTERGCPIADFGCCTLRELNAHIKKTHFIPQVSVSKVQFPALRRFRDTDAVTAPGVKSATTNSAAATPTASGVANAPIPVSSAERPGSDPEKPPVSRPKPSALSRNTCY
ncbi:hypothetical protein BDZ91DRAFT_327772 [Kalaharituber pfeilii]|nr:hypothetical protein BDZ91DRAFT_327772 [Kalaharituber pfeilii]